MKVKRQRFLEILDAGEVGGLEKDGADAVDEAVGVHGVLDELLYLLEVGRVEGDGVAAGFVCEHVEGVLGADPQHEASAFVGQAPLASEPMPPVAPRMA